MATGPKSLATGWYRQKHDDPSGTCGLTAYAGDYCGPATAYTINYWNRRFHNGATTSHPPEYWTLYQDNLAKSEYLATHFICGCTYPNCGSGTDLGDNNWMMGLNGWWSGTTSGYYYVTRGPSLASYKGDLVTDISSYYPLALDTHMTHDRHPLEGWSVPLNVEYYHYVTGNGYSNYGGVTAFYTRYADSSNVAPGQHNLYRSIDMQVLVSTNGIVW